jgi:hypothetical protein
MFLNRAVRDLRDAELALSAAPADRLVVLETQWFLFANIERVNRARYEANRIPTQDYLEARYNRLGAEIQLLRERAKQPMDIGLPRERHLEPNVLYDDPPIQFMAKVKVAASLAQLQELKQAQVDAAQEQLDVRFREFLAGRGTLDFVLESRTKLLLAQCRLYPDAATQVPFYEDHWLQKFEAEHVNQARFEAARITEQDVAQSRYDRLQAQLWMLDARAKEGANAVRFVETGRPFDPGADPGASRRIAQWKQQLLSTDRQTLQRDLLAAAQVETLARWREFLAGRGTLDFLLNSAHRLLDAEWALTRSKEEQQTLLTRHWDGMYLIWKITRARYEAGRIPIQDLAQTRHHLEQATGWLLQALGNGS